MRVKFKPNAHPLAALIGEEIGEVTNVTETDGNKTYTVFFSEYGAEFPLSADCFDEVAE